jgi:steroid 5-alpha reductase family enzyme
MSYFIILAVSLLFCAVGFWMYIYFFSLGYGLSVAAIGVTLAIGFWAQLGPAEFLACLLFVIYGFRLSGYLLVRELKSASYRKVLSPEMDRSAKMPIGPKLAIWISCGLLYTLQTIPVYFRLNNGVAADACLYVGLVVMVCGLVLETAADLQKTAAKRKDPYRFVDTGLFRVVRCPNYLGEMIFWLGVLVTGFTALQGVLQWAAALLGFALIVFIMFSGARRLEIRQDQNYGDDPEYQRYCKSVPILLPFVPLYSVEKYKWLVA